MKGAICFHNMVMPAKEGIVISGTKEGGDMAGSGLKRIDVEPGIERLEEVSRFVEEALLECDVPMKEVISMNIALDEIFSNITYYSGANHVAVECGVIENTVILRLYDDGIPYDPTQAGTVDVEQAAQGEKIGGLGIHMVKNMMDEVAYVYEDGRNVLIIKKVCKE